MPSREAVAARAAGLRRAQRAWDEGGLLQRIAALNVWRETIAAARAAIVDALLTDTGRRIESELEVDVVLSSIQRWCGLAPDLLATDAPWRAAVPGVTVQQSERPYELVGVISPWNFPLLLSLIDAVPALVAGCAVLVKPSEITPRFIEALAPTIGDVPIAFLPGDGRTGEDVIDVVDAVCFTGSVTTGRAVAEHAARRFIPAFLELGGKDPAIVLRSADVDRASSAVLWGSTANAGQSCQSIERIYVDRAIAAEFVRLLADKAGRVRLAEPNVGDGEIGPIIAERQVDVIAGHLDDAVARGARVVCGGQIEWHGGGAYCRPTVLTDVDHSMRVMTEETFGPVMPVMVVDSEDAAVALANDSSYGLSAAVFAGTADEALTVARRVRAGGVSINDAALTALVHDGEKNSFNLSGLGGSRMGPAALRRFARRQAFLVSESPGPDPWWFPQLRAD